MICRQTGAAHRLSQWMTDAETHSPICLDCGVVPPAGVPMKLTIVLPDDVADRYQNDATLQHTPIETILADQLQRFAHVGRVSRIVILNEVALSALEAMLGYGSIQHGADLVEKVQRVVDLRVGEVRVQLSPAQISEIQTRAAKNDRPFAQEFESIVRQAVDGLGAYV